MHPLDSGKLVNMWHSKYWERHSYTENKRSRVPPFSQTNTTNKKTNTNLNLEKD